VICGSNQHLFFEAAKLGRHLPRGAPREEGLWSKQMAYALAGSFAKQAPGSDVGADGSLRLGSQGLIVGSSGGSNNNAYGSTASLAVEQGAAYLGRRALAGSATLALAGQGADAAASIVPSANTSLYGLQDWTKLATQSGAWKAVLFVPELNRYVAVGKNAIQTSEEGTTWVTRTAPADRFWHRIAWAPDLGTLVAVASQPNSTPIMTSSDGITWVTRTSPTNLGISSVAYGRGRFVALQPGGAVITSTDGVTWTTASTPATRLWSDVIWAQELGLFVAVSVSGPSPQVMVSAEGTAWTTRATPLQDPAENLAAWTGVAWSPSLGVLAAVSRGGAEGRVLVSTNGGDSWATRAAPLSSWTSVAWSEELGMFIAVASKAAAGRVMTSNDGLTWTMRPADLIDEWGSVVWAAPGGGNNQAIATADLVGTERFGARGSWTRTSITGNWWDLAWAPELGVLIVADGTSSVIGRSTTAGISVTKVTATGIWYGVTWAPEINTFVAVGFEGKFAYSTTGATSWVTAAFGSQNCWDVAWAPETRTFLAVSGNNNYARSTDNGVSWMTVARTNQWYGIVWAAEIRTFVKVALSGANPRISYSTTGGDTWADASLTAAALFSVAWAPEMARFVAVGTSAVRMSTTGGVSWTNGTIPSGTWRRVIWAPEIRSFVAVGQSGVAAFSTTGGETWVQVDRPSGNGFGIEWLPEYGRIVAPDISSGISRLDYARNLPSYLYAARALPSSTPRVPATQLTALPGWTTSALTGAWRDITYSPDNQTLVAAANGGFARSTNGGESWVNASVAGDWTAVKWTPDSDDPGEVDIGTVTRASQDADGTDYVWTPPEDVDTVTVVIVAGGGGGGSSGVNSSSSSIYTSAGAGAGGVVVIENYSLSGGTVNLRVGAGKWLTSIGIQQTGPSGKNSVFDGQTALGGGGGVRSQRFITVNGISGGSGGAPSWAGTPGIGQQPQYTIDNGSVGIGYGNNSGVVVADYDRNPGGGGAGGAGMNGANGTGVGMNGGAGIDLSSIVGRKYGLNGIFAGGGGSTGFSTNLNGGNGGSNVGGTAHRTASSSSGNAPTGHGFWAWPHSGGGGGGVLQGGDVIGSAHGIIIVTFGDRTIAFHHGGFTDHIVTRSRLMTNMYGHKDAIAAAEAGDFFFQATADPIYNINRFLHTARYMAAGTNLLAYSFEASTWFSSTVTGAWKHLAFADVGITLALGTDAIATSDDGGIAWTTASFTGNWRTAVWANESRTFVIAGESGITGYSTDLGASWVTTSSGTTYAGTWEDVAWAPELNAFILVGLNTIGVSTTGGTSWQTLAETGDFRGVTWVPDLGCLVAVKHTGTAGSEILYSFDGGTTWTGAEATGNWARAAWASDFAALNVVGFDGNRAGRQLFAVTQTSPSLQIRAGSVPILTANDSGYVVRGTTSSFTGAHEVQLDEPLPVSGSPLWNGRIMVTTGGMAKVALAASVPHVRLSRAARDRRAYGVLNMSRGRTLVNSLGEGGMWVCDQAGALRNGDYVCSSDALGLGMRQESDRLCSYTAAKILHDCDFELEVESVRESALVIEEVDETPTTTATEDEATAVTEGESTTATAEGEATAVAEGESTTAAEGEAAAVTEGESTTAAEGEAAAVTEGESTAAEGEAAAVTEGESTTTATAEGEAAAATEGESTTTTTAEDETAAVTEGESTTAAEDETAAVTEGESTTTTAAEGESGTVTEGESTTATEGEAAEGDPVTLMATDPTSAPDADPAADDNPAAEADPAAESDPVEVKAEEEQAAAPPPPPAPRLVYRGATGGTAYDLRFFESVVVTSERESPLRELTLEEYLAAKEQGLPVLRAAFVACTYHCA